MIFGEIIVGKLTLGEKIVGEIFLSTFFFGMSVSLNLL
jgi:hypothetical protein